MSLLAAAAILAAAFLLAGGSPRALLRRVAHPRPDAGHAVRRVRHGLAPGLVAAAVLSGALIGGAPGAVTVYAVAAPTATAVSVWRRHAKRVAAVKNAAAVMSATRLLAGLLRLGHVPAAALRLAARDAPALAEVVAVERVGGAVAPVLRRIGEHGGSDGLAELGAAWELSERTGASLGATLDALAERLTAAGSLRDVVNAELAAPRATGRLLAALPLAGLLLGYGLGGDPLAFLTGSPAGQLSLVVGISLGCVGVLWTERIAGGDG